MSEQRAVSPGRTEDDAAEASLRPQTLAEFIGQKASRENLAVFIEAARGRGEALDHVLLHGPPGLGKTTLAQIVARELGVGFRATSGPVIQRATEKEQAKRYPDAPSVAVAFRKAIDAASPAHTAATQIGTIASPTAATRGG